MRGTSQAQDGRFTNKEKKLIKLMKFDQILDVPVDIDKVIVDTIKPWIAARVCELLGFEDEVVIDYIYEMLETEKPPNPQKMQIYLTGFLEAKNSRIFMRELWALLLSAQNNNGIPREIVDAKKEEILIKQREQERLDKVITTGVPQEKANEVSESTVLANNFSEENAIDVEIEQKKNKPLYKPKESRRHESPHKDRKGRRTISRSPSPRYIRRKRSSSYHREDSRAFYGSKRNSRYKSDSRRDSTCETRRYSSKYHDRSSSSDETGSPIKDKAQAIRNGTPYNEENNRTKRNKDASITPKHLISKIDYKLNETSLSPVRRKRDRSRSINIKEKKSVDKDKLLNGRKRRRSKHNYSSKRNSYDSRSSSEDRSSTSYSSSSISSVSTNKKEQDDSEYLEDKLRKEALKSISHKSHDRRKQEE